MRAAFGFHPEAGDGWLAQLPFGPDDVTAGSETELQAAVVGSRDHVDLPQIIEDSGFFANLRKRARSGELTPRRVTELRDFLDGNREQVWENSWVRLPLATLSPYARMILEQDLRARRNDPSSGSRSDRRQFLLVGADGEALLRVPISYLLKLALADLIGTLPPLSPQLQGTGERLLGHFLNDNTSPETHSFHVVSLQRQTGMGRALAEETALRYLTTQLLTAYANRHFALTEHGQTARVYFAPHPPQRQRLLNELIPDAFYRELFMSPCLSGWDDGESKHRYMHLCHQVLSRSQLNAVAKLREAGIITSNLVVLPNVSNISLANNGLHLSLGSRRLTARLADPKSGCGPAEEKWAGDLVVKMVEHFLPLFVGTYSAAPYRLGFADFHPERALGFLPHELDFTHLRMLWRRWRKKADLSVCGHDLTPFGPTWIDRSVSRLFHLRGDVLPDFRLIDYPVSLLSTPRSPSCNGQLGNHDRLKHDLADQGVFDKQMSVYLLYKMREFQRMGFSGFEGRHYSLFPDLDRDLAEAVNLQTLITAFACKQMLLGHIHHRFIPDDPVVESERRQFFFAAALGVPTVFVHRSSRNIFLQRLLRRTAGVRASRRYPGYWRVPLDSFRLALLALLREEGADLVEAHGLSGTLDDLERRLRDPAATAEGRLTRSILKGVGAKSSLALSAEEFNAGAEDFYRIDLRRRQSAAAFDLLERECARLDAATDLAAPLRSDLYALLDDDGAAAFCRRLRGSVLAETADAGALRRLLALTLVVETDLAQRAQQSWWREEPRAASVC
ncbi:MAG: hypothetical protein A2091_13165 [Desulfuromonadales bacterium GWD2_61_12]|nr:MAG: hypothetical protein A2091_13165 [Desulfuromonadales bacterium GWD2_61_12]HBT83183.1 hypothetical protein [Desulfuromonas sp.]